MVGRFLAAAGLLASLAATPAYAQLGDKVKINGYGSVEFEKLLGDEGRGGQERILRLRRPRPRLQLPPHRSGPRGHGPHLGARGGHGERLRQRGGRVRPHRVLRHGLAQGPRGEDVHPLRPLQRDPHREAPLFLAVKEPSATDRTDRLGSPIRFFARWATGLALVGQGRLSGREVEYQVHLTNGDSLSTNPFEKDDNVAKAVAVRARFHPTKSLALGASFYDDSFVELTADGERGTAETKRLSWSADGTWETTRAGVELECVSGRLTPSAVPSFWRFGFEATVWAKLGRVRPYARYEYHDPNQDKDDDDAQVLLGGLNVRLDDTLFLKVELDRFDSGPDNSRLKGVAYTEFKASLAVGF